MLPEALKVALNEAVTDCDCDRLAQDARSLSKAYRTLSGSGEHLVTTVDGAAAYAASRMPATYEAVYAALSESLRACDLHPTTLLDCGAGTGAASWAANELLNLASITCVEREKAMRDVGRAMMRAGGGALADARWFSRDIVWDEPFPSAQLVVEGYMLCELRDRDRDAALLRLWAASEQLLLLVEPGTPQGFANLRSARETLIACGAYVAAPCPLSVHTCPMKENDWCHFSVRLSRTKLHRALKGGEAPYEDEKFTYLAFTRTPPASPCMARVLRHPQIAPGHIELVLCEASGISRRMVTKKDPIWKKVRKMGAGSRL